VSFSSSSSYYYYYYYYYSLYRTVMLMGPVMMVVVWYGMVTGVREKVASPLSGSVEEDIAGAFIALSRSSNGHHGVESKEGTKRPRNRTSKFRGEEEEEEETGRGRVILMMRKGGRMLMIYYYYYYYYYYNIRCDTCLQ